MIKDDLISLVEKAVKKAQKSGDLPPFDLPSFAVDHPKNPEHGDYSTNIAMQSARLAKMAPIKIAEQIVDAPARDRFHRPGRRHAAGLHQLHPV